MRKIDDQHWQLVKIEFERESRNFLRHGHLPSGCDVIVCWVHNWPECPVEVIELSTLRVWGRRGSSSFYGGVNMLRSAVEPF